MATYFFLARVRLWRSCFRLSLVTPLLLLRNTILHMKRIVTTTRTYQHVLKPQHTDRMLTVSNLTRAVESTFAGTYVFEGVCFSSLSRWLFGWQRHHRHCLRHACISNPGHVEHLNENVSEQCLIPINNSASQLPAAYVITPMVPTATASKINRHSYTHART